MKLQAWISKDRAIPMFKKYHDISIAYDSLGETTEAESRPLLLPGGKICRPQPAKPVSVIA